EKRVEIQVCYSHVLEPLQIVRLLYIRRFASLTSASRTYLGQKIPAVSTLRSLFEKTFTFLLLNGCVSSPHGVHGIPYHFKIFLVAPVLCVHLHFPLSPISSSMVRFAVFCMDHSSLIFFHDL